jgi:hypothetical protein
MRRLAAQGLLALGVAFVVMAPAVHWLVPGLAAREPAQVNQQLFLQGTGDFTDPGTQKVYKNVPLQVSRYITTACTGGDPTQSKSSVSCPQGQLGSGDTAVWDQRIEFTGVGDGKRIVVAVYLDVIAFDRSTGAARTGLGQTHDHLGSQVFFFPFNTKKATYPLWDVASNKVEPATFVQETTYAGQHVYEFDQNATIDLGNFTASGTAPGKLFGRPSEPSVAAHQIYVTNRQIFVSPRTGTILGETENTSLTGQALDGRGTPFPIFSSDHFTTAPESQAFLAGKARAADKALDLLQNVLPILLIAVGLLAIIIGLVLRRRWAPPPSLPPPVWPV